MADVSKLNNGTTTYDIKDETARTSIANLGTDLTNNLVHKTGSEIITGLKTLNNDIRFVVSDTPEQEGSGAQKNITALCGTDGSSYLFFAKDSTTLRSKVGLRTQTPWSEFGLKAVSDTATTLYVNQYVRNISGSIFAAAAMPSTTVAYRFVTDGTIPTGSQFDPYTATCNGWLMISFYSKTNVDGCAIYITDTTNDGGSTNLIKSSCVNKMIYPVTKGHVYIVSLIAATAWSDVISSAYYFRINKCQAEV